jgi:hypothetical protein
MTNFNVYCDESGHLPNDGQSVMVLGALWCPLEQTRVIGEQLRALKRKHGLSPQFETKWTKVSPAKVTFYLETVEYFLSNDLLRFRALVIPDKSRLNHDAFDQDHDTWYYKMYYSMLKVIIAPDDRFRIYVDIKDTRSANKMRKLHDCLCNTIYDFDQAIIERVQTVRSHEVEQLQLADLLIGAVRHAQGGATGDGPKDKLVQLIQQRTRYRLTRSTLLNERKFNVLIWQPSEAR